MPEADDHLAVVHTPADIGFGFVRRLVTLLDFERHFVRAAMFRTTQSADTAAQRGIHVGTRACDHATGES